MAAAPWRSSRLGSTGSSRARSVVARLDGAPSVVVGAEAADGDRSGGEVGIEALGAAGGSGAAVQGRRRASGCCCFYTRALGLRPEHDCCWASVPMMGRVACIGTNAEGEGQARARQGAGRRRRGGACPSQGGGGVWERLAPRVGAQGRCLLDLTGRDLGQGGAGPRGVVVQGWLRGARRELGWEKGSGAVGPNGFPHF